ncbi:MAG TPA: SpoIID/LytB domain-containing protein [Candidatus Baltobacteraceae bacterium]|jgi:stage II sporulation protein D|nr:SpoIID/LytB domain-containing protein [Candidatus Baltobacteraceae bacterium]
MNRLDFMNGVAAAFTIKHLAMQTDSDIGDPALASGSQALRVLLGHGDAAPLEAGTFLFQGRGYRGTFSDSSKGIVNTVPLEEYLYSVVPREMPRLWPAAALQAQAVVARTFVLSRSNPRAEYDLVPSEADQVYTGMDAERPQTSAAVQATSGTVLRFGGGFASVLYSSCCGGHTESSAQAWGGQPISYLNGVPCTFCADSPWYNWAQTIALDDLRERLNAAIAPMPQIERIWLDAPDSSGRSVYWNVAGQGTIQRIKAADVRRALGMRTLPSLLIRKFIAPAGAQPERTVHIEGSGLGHGVGLCQWGCRGMAITGADLQTILRQYYPGTTLAHV